MRDYSQCKNQLFDALRGGSPARLAKYRRELAKSLEAIRACRTPAAADEFIVSAGYVSPLNHRYEWMGASTHNATFDKRGDYANLPACMLDGLRDVGDAHDIVRSLARGWYTDREFQEEMYSGHVWQLPARNGEPQYIAGYLEVDAGYAVLDATRGRISIFDTKEDAARAGDEVARIHAEQECDYQEKWREANAIDERIAEQREVLRETRAEFSTHAIAFRAIYYGPIKRNAKHAHEVCTRIRKQLATLRARFIAELESLNGAKRERAMIDIET